MFGRTHIVLCFLVVLLVTGVGITLSFKGFNSQDTHVTISTGTMTISGNKTINGENRTITVAPAEFNGPRFTSSLESLGVNVFLSSSSVKTGETLRMRINLTGPKAWNVSLARFTVANSNEEKVYDVCIWLPHRTLATGENPPQDYVFYLEWEAKRSPTAGNVEVSPGLYSFTIMFEVEDKELAVRGTIEVK